MKDRNECVLVTGGAGFIGRHVVDCLLKKPPPLKKVVVLDNLYNGSRENIAEFADHERFVRFVEGDINDAKLIGELFAKYKFKTVFHLAACINVQESIDDPGKVFHSDVVGTFELLETARAYDCRFVFTSTCMVYDKCRKESGIAENDPVKPASPYAADKLAGENMVLGHFHAYGLPVVILRPFNTYGPFQKSTGEGGVVSIFCEKELRGETLNIYGDGTQTRDLLFVTDCARFIVEAGYSEDCEGRVLNAGYGSDVTINDLAAMICPDHAKIRHVDHIHPQSEIMKLKCDSTLAESLIGWSPEVTLESGIRRTFEWIAKRGN
jgi:dTDP-glucose 4,6-dehydratase